MTFTKHIAPILQRSCQNCHRPDGVAPMSLITYEEVRPWARAIKQRTGLGPRAGVMPPWYIEKNIGIQHYKDDPSLSEVEVATVAKWADTGAPRGNPADMPPPHQVRPTAASGGSASPISSFQPRNCWSRATRPTGGARSRAFRSASPRIVTSRPSRSAK